MPKINQSLLNKLQSGLALNSSRVYGLIQTKASQTALDRNLAALLVAAERNIPYHKYSTAEERAQIRTFLGGGGAEAPSLRVTATNEVSPRPFKTKKVGRNTKAKKTKDTVFVAYGRNESLRKSMFNFLRALGLKPLEWEKVILMAKRVNPQIEEAIDAAMAQAAAVLVLFSPDDEARLKESFADSKSETKLMGQPRANVIFEAGIALGRHPEKTLLVEVGRLRKFSDIAGRHVVRLTNDFGKRNDLANRLEKIGCKVDRKGTDWTSAGEFAI
jgi:predicted nucleotide-binding protein